MSQQSQNILAQNSLPENPSIVILTGAGISAESGIETFRDQGGFWENYRIEDVASPEAFRQSPDKVHEFYNMRRRQLTDETIKPNKAHEALARLTHKLEDKVLLVTQNVDNLLERAGGNGILHMHGELMKIRCVNCAHVCPWNKDIFADTKCPNCRVEGHLRPHIVWFGEIPFGLEMIYRALSNCDLFVAIGTSGAVYPASGFIQDARQSNCDRTVEINPERTEISAFFYEIITGPATETVPEFVDELIKSGKYT